MSKLRFSNDVPPGGPDDVDKILDEQLQDPEFRATYEDAEARNALIQFFASLRRELGWSQSELAVKLKTTQSAVSDFEKKVVEPRLPTLQRWARAFGYRLELQLWKGPLVHYNSWVHRSLPYESVIQAVRVDDEIARIWFAGAAKVNERTGEKVTRVAVESKDVEVDEVHFNESALSESEYWRQLTSHLGVST